MRSYARRICLALASLLLLTGCQLLSDLGEALSDVLERIIPRLP